MMDGYGEDSVVGARNLLVSTKMGPCVARKSGLDHEVLTVTVYLAAEVQL